MDTRMRIYSPMHRRPRACARRAPILRTPTTAIMPPPKSPRPRSDGNRVPQTPPLAGSARTPHPSGGGEKVPFTSRARAAPKREKKYRRRGRQEEPTLRRLHSEVARLSSPLDVDQGILPRWSARTALGQAGLPSAGCRRRASASADNRGAIMVVRLGPRDIEKKNIGPPHRGSGAA